MKNLPIVEYEQKEQDLTKIYEEYKDCQKCPTLCASRTTVVFGVGNPNADIVIVAEAPGENEDKEGQPLIGPSGRILDYFLAKAAYKYYPDKFPDFGKMLKSFKESSAYGRVNYSWADHMEVKMALSDMIFYTNSVLCRPPDNRDPSTTELKNCNDRLNNLICKIDPIIILTVGRIALESVVGKKVTSILKVRGQLMDAKLKGELTDIQYSIIPVLHPAFLMRNPTKEKGGIWDKTMGDVEKAIGMVDNYYRMAE